MTITRKQYRKLKNSKFKRIFNMRMEEFKEVLAEFNVPYRLSGDIAYHDLALGYYTEHLQTNNTISIVGHFNVDGERYIATNKTEFRYCLGKSIIKAKELEIHLKLFSMKQDFDD